MTFNTTIGRYHRPTFEPRAAYVAARDMLWGNDAVGYTTVKSDLEQPLDREALQPPCDDQLAAKLYRTGFLAMVLTDDGQPMLIDRTRAETAPPSVPREPVLPKEPEPGPEPELRVKSHGFGRYTVVDRDGNRISPEGEWLSKAEAQQLVEMG